MTKLKHKLEFTVFPPPNHLLYTFACQASKSTLANPLSPPISIINQPIRPALACPPTKPALAHHQSQACTCPATHPPSLHLLEFSPNTHSPTHPPSPNMTTYPLSSHLPALDHPPTKHALAHPQSQSLHLTTHPPSLHFPTHPPSSHSPALDHPPTKPALACPSTKPAWAPPMTAHPPTKLVIARTLNMPAITCTPIKPSLACPCRPSSPHSPTYRVHPWLPLPYPTPKPNFPPSSYELSLPLLTPSPPLHDYIMGVVEFCHRFIS
ncbi:uncharacterized [Tachysurus ichikawai]